MTALQRVVRRLTCPRAHGAKSVHLQLTFDLCQDSHKTQVLLCCLILSFLSLCSSATSVTEIKDLQICLGELKVSLESSDALLYAPSIDGFKDQCKNKVLRCYMLELTMIIAEEDINDPKAPCISEFNEDLKPEDGCPPCETYSLEESKTFYKNLINILQKIAAEKSK